MVDILGRVILFMLLVVAQALIFGRMHLFDCATPLIYVYFVLTFHRGYPRWIILLWSFAMGLCVDAFANTPGVATVSLTAVGFVQPYFFSLFVPDDTSEDFAPSVKSMGMLKFSFFTGVLLLLFCILLFSLEAFSFFDWRHWLLCVAGSWLITIMLILTMESVRSK